MRKLAFSFVLVVFLGLATSARADGPLPDRFGEWQSPETNSACLHHPQKLVLPETPVTKEAGQKMVYDEDYCLGQKKILVVVREFGDPSGAYEFYTSELNTSMNGSTLGPGTAVTKDTFFALVGNFAVSVSNHQNISEQDLALLLKALKRKASATPLPPMRTFLSSDGLAQGTQRYSFGPAGYEAAVKSLDRAAYADLKPELGFSSGAEVMLGRYWYGRGPGDVLLLVEFPTPQLAEQQLHHIQPLLASKPEFLGTTVERNASLLSLVLSPSSPEMAVRLRKSISYETAITWNEPSQTLTDPPWLLVLKTIFFAAGIFCAVAAVGGILFGIFRLLMKRLFPGKVFDRSSSVELLQLGLNSKEIKSDDFY
jgi:hypothetical protein